MMVLLSLAHSTVLPLRSSLSTTMRRDVKTPSLVFTGIPEMETFLLQVILITVFELNWEWRKMILSWFSHWLKIVPCQTVAPPPTTVQSRAILLSHPEQSQYSDLGNWLAFTKPEFCKNHYQQHYCLCLSSSTTTYNSNDEYWQIWLPHLEFKVTSRMNLDNAE